MEMGQFPGASLKRMAWGLVIQLDESLTKLEMYQILEEMRRRVDDLYPEAPELSVVTMALAGITGSAGHLRKAEPLTHLNGKALGPSAVEPVKADAWNAVNDLERDLQG